MFKSSYIPGSATDAITKEVIEKFMALIWKPQDVSTYKTWVAAIIDEASDNLSDWESSFLDSISGKLSLGYNLSENQAEKLEELYTKHTK